MKNQMLIVFSLLIVLMIPVHAVDWVLDGESVANSSPEPDGISYTLRNPLGYDYTGFYLEAGCWAPKAANQTWSCCGFGNKVLIPYSDDYYRNYVRTYSGSRYYEQPHAYYCTIITENALDGKTASCGGTGRSTSDPDGNVFAVKVIVWNVNPIIFTSNFQQRDERWRNDPYGDRGQSTIGAHGCFLCCTCNALNAIGIGVTPKELNRYMRDNHGYSGLLVNLNVVESYARKVHNTVITAKDAGDNTSIRELMLRTFVYPWTHGNSGHWVNTICFRGFHGTAAQILDPMGRSNQMPYGSKYGSLYGSGRAIYLAWNPKTKSSAWNGATSLTGSSLLAESHWMLDDSSFETSTNQTKANLISQTEGDTQDERQSGIAVPTWLGSHITAWASTSNVALHLICAGKEVAVSQQEVIENGETDEMTDCGTFLGLTNQPPGDYILRIQGLAGTSYEGNICLSSDSADVQFIPFSGILSESGSAEIAFTHQCLGWYDEIGPINNMYVGTNILVDDGVITAIVPGGFWMQPVQHTFPAVFVQWNEPVSALTRVRDLQGVIATSGQQKIIQAASLTLCPECEPSGNDWVKDAIATPAAKVATTFHLLVDLVGTYGGVWANGILVDGLRVQIDAGRDTLSISGGATVMVKGVYHTDGVFYCKEARYVSCFGGSQVPPR